MGSYPSGGARRGGFSWEAEPGLRRAVDGL